MVIKLTDRTVASMPIPQLPQRQVEYWDQSVPGFGVCVGYGGKKTFVLRYRRNGRLRRLTLGPYPHLKLGKARKKAKIHLGDVADGGDPAEDKSKARSTPTFDDLAKDYLKVAEKKHRSVSEERRIIEKDLKAAFGSRLVTEVRRHDIRDLVERIATERQAPVMANRTLGLLSRLFNFALDHEWVEANPAARMAPPGSEQSRDRVLNDDEIATVWRALDSLGRPNPETSETIKQQKPAITPATAVAFQVQFLTAQRPGEVRSMRWEDVDLDRGWWTIPAHQSKNGQPHRVPLTDTVKELLEARRKIDPDARWVFENVRGLGPVTHRGKKAAAALSRRLKVAFRAHDLRRTAATMMAQAAVPHAHIARVLNHIEAGPSATRVYDRYQYDKEKRRALVALEKRLTKVLDAKPATSSDFSRR